MGLSVDKLLQDALTLSEDERAALIDGLLTSLTRPDAEAEAEWLHELRSRIAAYRAGEMAAFDSEVVFAEFDSLDG